MWVSVQSAAAAIWIRAQYIEVSDPHWTYFEGLYLAVGTVILSECCSVLSSMTKTNQLVPKLKCSKIPWAVPGRGLLTGMPFYWPREGPLKVGVNVA